MEVLETRLFSILKEDYENSSKQFGDVYNCPFSMAVKRQFPEWKDTEVYLSWINNIAPSPVDPEYFVSRCVGRITNVFSIGNFEELKEGKEFFTEITIFKN